MGILKRLGGGSELDRLAAEVRADLRRRGITDSWVESDGHSVRYRTAEDGEPAWLGLDNLARKVRDVPRQERVALVAAHLDLMFEGKPDLPRAWPEAAPRLRLVFRDIVFGQSAHGPVVDLVSRPALDLLRVFPVVDFPRSVAYVNRKLLEDWAVSEDELFATALRNLEALAIAEGELGRSTIPASVTYRETGTEYYTSRLLLPGWIAAHTERVGGPPVVFAPDRNTLIVSTTASRGLRGVQRDVIARWKDAEHPLTPQPYALDERGLLSPYRPAPDDPEGRALVEVAHRMHVAHQYASQGGMLQERITRNGAEVHVASVMVWQKPDGSTVSQAVWSPGDCLLPQVDEVTLYRGVEELCTVPWQVLAEEVPLQVAPDLDPVRYWMTTWPDAATLERLRARAVPAPPPG